MAWHPKLPTTWSPSIQNRADERQEYKKLHKSDPIPPSNTPLNPFPNRTWNECNEIKGKDALKKSFLEPLLKGIDSGVKQAVKALICLMDQEASDITEEVRKRMGVPEKTLKKPLDECTEKEKDQRNELKAEARCLLTLLTKRLENEYDGKYKSSELHLEPFKDGSLETRYQLRFLKLKTLSVTGGLAVWTPHYTSFDLLGFIMGQLAQQQPWSFGSSRETYHIELLRLYSNWCRILGELPGMVCITTFGNDIVLGASIDSRPAKIKAAIQASRRNEFKPESINALKMPKHAKGTQKGQCVKEYSCGNCAETNAFIVYSYRNQTAADVKGLAMAPHNGDIVDPCINCQTVLQQLGHSSIWSTFSAATVQEVLPSQPPSATAPSTPPKFLQYAYQ